MGPECFVYQYTMSSWCVTDYGPGMFCVPVHYVIMVCDRLCHPAAVRPVVAPDLRACAAAPAPAKRGCSPAAAGAYGRKAAYVFITPNVNDVTHQSLTI